MPPDVDKKLDVSNEVGRVTVAAEETRLLYKALGGTEVLADSTPVDQVVKVTSDFGKELQPGVLGVARLVPIANELGSPNLLNRSAAYLALNQYRADPESNEYLRALSVDLGVVIPQFLEKHYQSITTNPNGQFNLIPLLDVLELMADSPSKLVKNPQGVNIESILISASNLYVSLRNIRDNPQSASQNNLSKMLYSAESFLQPLMEVIGYDGLVMAIKQEVDLLRLSLNDGEYDGITQEKLDVANEMLDQLPSTEQMPEIIDDLMSIITMRQTESRLVLDDTYGHGIEIGAGHVLEASRDEDDFIDQDDDFIEEDTGSSIDNMRWVWRKKTAASAARKLILEDERTGKKLKPADVKPISDLVALTVIVDSVEDLTYYFKLAAGILQDLKPSQIALTTSRHKDSPFHAKTERGDGIVEALEVDLGNLGARLNTKISDNGHKVIKITLQYKPKSVKVPIPIEIVFQTESDRKKSRSGEPAHAFKNIGYKLSDIQTIQAIKELGELPRRRALTGDAILTVQSMQRGNEQFPRIDFDKKVQKALGARASRGYKPKS